MVTVFKFSFIDSPSDKLVMVKFVQDTSKFWYKADISREQGTWRGSKGLLEHLSYWVLRLLVGGDLL
jgi:hypothetical protein